MNLFRGISIEENLTRNEELLIAVFVWYSFLYLSLSLFTNLQYLYTYKDVVVITFDLRDPRLQVQSAFLYYNYLIRISKTKWEIAIDLIYIITSK